MGIGDEPGRPESIESKVRAEIMAQERPEHLRPEDVWLFHQRLSWYLEHFISKISLGKVKDVSRYPSTQRKLLSPREIVLKRSPGSDPEKERKESGHSERRWNETDEQFTESVEKAVEESKVDKEALKAYTSIPHSEQSQADRAQDEKFLLPIYIKLREMGYTHADLTL